MPKRTTNIRKRKDSRWEGRYKIGLYENGNTKYRSVYGKTYAEVKEKLCKAKTDPESRSLNKVREKTFGEVLKFWSENNRVAIKESSAYKYDYLINKHIIPELGDIEISAICVPLVNSFVDKKLRDGRLDSSGGLSASYVKTIMLIIRSALRFAVEEGYCADLRGKIVKPMECRKEPAVLDRKDAKRFEEFLINEGSITAIGTVISLNTGLRIGEICALKWQDVDLKNRIIHARHTVARVKSDNNASTSSLILDTPKTKASERDIPISSFLFPIIAEMKEKSASDFVVSDRDGFISPRTYEYRYHRLLRRCGIESINYHALRHTFATRCVEAGVDVKTLSEILGHSNVSVTLNTYVHSSISLKRTQLEKLSAQ